MSLERIAAPQARSLAFVPQPKLADAGGMKDGASEVVRSRLFPENTFVLGNSVPAEALITTCTTPRYLRTGEAIDFDQVRQTALTARREIVAWWKSETGQEFDSYKLGDRFAEVRDRFRAHSGTREALRLLGQDPELAAKLPIPWWNEIACAEVSFEPRAGSAYAALTRRHSYETQLMRMGHDLGILSVSVAGIVRTAPEDGMPNGAWVMGLRGGATFPNTFHVPAGALQATEGILDGTESAWRVFVRTELREEIGVDHSGVTRGTFAGRFLDLGIDKGPTYLFGVETAYTMTQLDALWRGNKHDDKQEHRALLFIPADPQSVRAFINEYYVGPVANRLDRADSERRLLHPGALALCMASGISPFELAPLIRGDGTL